MIKKLILQVLCAPLSLAGMGGAVTKPATTPPALALTAAPHTTLSGASIVAERPIKTGRIGLGLSVKSGSSGQPVLAQVKQAGPPASSSVGAPWTQPYLNYGYLRKAWDTAGRDWIQVNSGVKFNDVTKQWEIDSTWPYASADVAQLAYNIESATRGAINMASTCRDSALLDELSAFYLTYAQRFTTLGALRRMQALGLSTSLLAGQGDDSTRTLIWIEPTGTTKRVRECLLCNTQFFHPAARLVRIIAALPPSKRTAVQKQFVTFYAPLIVHDHLLRVLFQSDWDYWEDKTLPKHLVDIWSAILTDRTRPKLSYQRGMFDWDLWLIATSAEILGANASDPQLVPLKTQEKLALHQAVDVGVKLFRKKRTVYPETKNLQGKVVGSASYFNGDFDQQRSPKGASWDISHFYRVPVFLRSMYDNRKATGNTFPTLQELNLVVNQYLYKVLEGDFHLPLFHNFFDGSDGWFRVGYHGSGFGYPPSKDCDSHNPLHPCLIVGAVQGWGLLAFVNSDVVRLYHGLAQLAWADDAATVSFRERYYYYNDQPYSAADAHSSPQYPYLLFEVLSQVPQKLDGCNIRNNTFAHVDDELGARSGAPLSQEDRRPYRFSK